MKETWDAVDSYLVASLVPQDEPLHLALRESTDQGLPQINVAPNQGKMLYLFAQIQGAKRILEVGTLGGYSTIWLARALPVDGKLITLELEPHHAAVARTNVDRAGVGDQVEIIVGPAAESLATLEGQVFDMIFVDADKPSNPVYYDWALRLSRPGTLIIVDNVVRNGGVVDPNNVDEGVIGVQKLIEIVNKDPRVEATAIQTVGSKGYDGFMIARVR